MDSLDKFIERNSTYIEALEQIEELKQQLAEKEKEIFDFAVEQLTEIRDYVKECTSLDMVEGKIRLDIAKKIRLKINQLKENKNVN